MGFIPNGEGEKKNSGFLYVKAKEGLSSCSKCSQIHMWSSFLGQNYSLQGVLGHVDGLSF